MFPKRGRKINMNYNNKGIYTFIGILTYIVTKITLGYIGIENIPAPIIVPILILSYFMFLIYIRRKNIPSKVKPYLTLILILIAIFFTTTIIMLIGTKYFYNAIEKYKILMIILITANLLSLVILAYILMTINKK